MGLKNQNWFLGKCLTEERERTEFAYLSAKALTLGLIRRENTQGHISQACGATQMFLDRFPNHKRSINRESPIRPYKLNNSMRRDWITFLSPKSGSYGRRDFGYSWDTLKFCLTRKYGGRVSGGGGGDNEFEIVLRLMVEFKSSN